jgi:hypothetical protein
VTLPARFLAKIQIDPIAGCHLWTGAKNAAGYGYFSWHGKNRYAHRVAWEMAYGPIPAGQQIDHVVCDTTSCVNVGHLALSTGRANTLRSTRSGSAVNARKTECVRGHPLSGDNLHRDPSGRRICRACKRLESTSDQARRRKAEWWRRNHGVKH